MPFFSIIVPVYNSEKYLRRCIDSISKQNFDEIEIILINDASTDTSESIIKEYNDNRIRYFKNDKNEGVSFSRNRGIKEAKGRYVMFVDADDSIMPLTFEKLYDRLINEEPDMLKYEFMDFVSGEYHGIYNTYFEEKKYVKDEKAEILHALLKSKRMLFFQIGTYVFKTNFIKDKFFHDVNYYDNFIFMLNAYVEATSISILNENLYMNNIYMGSLTKKHYIDYLSYLIYVTKYLCDEFEKNEKYTDYKDDIVRFLIESEIFTSIEYAKGIIYEYSHSLDLDIARNNVKKFLSEKSVKKILSHYKNVPKLEYINIKLEDEKKTKEINVYRKKKKDEYDKVMNDLNEMAIAEDEEKINTYYWDYMDIRQEKIYEKYGVNCPVEYCINREKKLIYMLVPKVACSTFKQSLTDYDFSDNYSVHSMIRQRDMKASNILTDEEKKYFIFSFVRNPFERIVSAYESKLKTDIRNGYNQWIMYMHGILAKDEGFDKFIRTVCSIPLDRDDRHFMSQYLLLYDKNGKQIPDFIGHYENINEDYEKIRVKYDLRPLPHLNKTDKRDKKDFRTYFTLETAEMYHKKYIKDFETFSYEDEYEKLIEYIKRSK